MPRFLIQTIISRVIEAEDEDEAKECAESCAVGVGDSDEVVTVGVIELDAMPARTK